MKPCANIKPPGTCMLAYMFPVVFALAYGEAATVNKMRSIL